MNFNPFHSMGLCEEVTTIPEPNSLGRDPSHIPAPPLVLRLDLPV